MFETWIYHSQNQQVDFIEILFGIMVDNFDIILNIWTTLIREIWPQRPSSTYV
jgi:hypothetical protein